ncbi:MAG: SPOR domain-containing protein [Deltaproteobacteria bacterium]|nr:SPOR domain-containing protein [Deltaproteobacteria bacterium]
MERAAALENSSAYHQAAREYAVVAGRYPSTSYYKSSVWKAALLNIHPANSKIDTSAARFWLNVYLGLPLTDEEKENATLYVSMIERINGLQAQVSSLVSERDKLLDVTRKQSGDIVTGTQRLGELEAELAKARDALKKMKEVDVRMQRSKDKTNNITSPELAQKASELNNDQDNTQRSTKNHALIPQYFYPYTIQVSSRRNKEISTREAMKIRNKGNSGFVSHAHIPGQEHPQAIVVKMPFAVQIGVFSGDEELKKVDADLRSKGYVAFSVPDRLDNNKTRLLVGAFRTEKEAEILAKELDKEGFRPKVIQR